MVLLKGGVYVIFKDVDKGVLRLKCLGAMVQPCCRRFRNHNSVIMGAFLLREWSSENLLTGRLSVKGGVCRC